MKPQTVLVPLEWRFGKQSSAHVAVRAFPVFAEVRIVYRTKYGRPAEIHYVYATMEEAKERFRETFKKEKIYKVIGHGKVLTF